MGLRKNLNEYEKMKIAASFPAYNEPLKTVRFARFVSKRGKPMDSDKLLLYPADIPTKEETYEVTLPPDTRTPNFAEYRGKMKCFYLTCRGVYFVRNVPGFS